MMKKKMKRFCALMLSMCVILSLTACSTNNQDAASASGENADSPKDPEPAPASEDTKVSDSEDTSEEHEPITLRIYTRYSDDDSILPYDYMVSELAKDMPWVTLELDPQAADDNVKIKSYAATGDMPDIFNITGLDVIDTLNQSGNIADLTDKVKANGFADKVLPNSQSKLYHPNDDKVYTLPYMGNEVTLLFANTELFEKNKIKIPETLDELKTACTEFNKLGITPIATFGKETWLCMALVEMIITRYVPSGFRGLDDGTVTIDDPGFLQGAQEVLDLVNAGMLSSSAVNTNYEQAAAQFYNGEAAMLVNGQWEISSSEEKLGDKATWIPLPSKTEEDFQTAQYNFVGGSGTPGGFAVSPHSENYDTAVEVACYIAEKYAWFNYNMRGSVMVAIDVDKEPNVEMPAMMQKLADYIPKMGETTLLFSLSGTELTVTIQDECQRLLSGNTTAEEFVANIKRVIN
ncbi:extracellular solute-binding protein [Lachnospiraceae bacterium ZAX-1]